MGLKIICLTDHKVHSDNNSVYSLCRSFLTSERVDSLDVASRGFSENDGLFKSMEGTEVMAAPVLEDFYYSESDALFKRDWRRVELNDYDLILVRFPYPVAPGLFEFLAEKIDERKFVNRPTGILETGSKAFLFHFSEFCPAMQICRSEEDITAFSRVFPVVLKPLRSYGGKGVVKVDRGLVNPGKEATPLKEYLEQEDVDLPILAMKYLENVTQGDRRTVVANGRVITSSTRFPAKGNWLCNVAQGGHSQMTDPSEEELEMIKVISPVLLEKGIVVYGMDTLVGDDGKRRLSEINTLSIGGIYPAEKESKIPYSKMVSDAILDYFTSL